MTAELHQVQIRGNESVLQQVGVTGGAMSRREPLTTLIAFNGGFKNVLPDSYGKERHGRLVWVYLKARCADTLVGSLWLTAGTVKERSSLQQQLVRSPPFSFTGEFGFFSPLFLILWVWIKPNCSSWFNKMFLGKNICFCQALSLKTDKQTKKKKVNDDADHRSRGVSSWGNTEDSTPFVEHLCVHVAVRSTSKKKMQMNDEFFHLPLLGVGCIEINSRWSKARHNFWGRGAVLWHAEPEFQWSLKLMKTVRGNVVMLPVWHNT